MADRLLRRTLLGWGLLIVGGLEAVSRLLISDLLSAGGELVGMASYPLWPPVVAVVGVGVVLATGWGPVEERDMKAIATMVPALALVAIGGHAVALIGGFMLYLLIDTPARFALYSLEIADPFVGSDAMFVPFVGWFVCTVIAWTVPAIVLTRVVDGSGIAAGVVDALSYPQYCPRQLLRLLALAAGMVAVPALLMLAGFRTTVTPGSTLELLGETGIFATAMVIPFIWLVIARSVTASPPLMGRGRASDASSQISPRKREDTPPDRPAVSLTQIALAGLLVLSLVATAGAVRAAEFRPVDTDPEPLPDEPDELVATAVANTDRTDYDHTRLNATDDTLIIRVQLDRTNRQLKGWAPENTTVTYLSTDTFYMGVPNETDPERIMDRAIPGYYTGDFESGEEMSVSFDETDSWEIVDEGEDTVRLEPSEPADVYQAVTGVALDHQFGEPEIHEANGWVVVDTDRKALSHAEFNLNISDHATSEADPEYNEQIRHEFESDITVERPDQSDSLSPLRVFWRVLLY